MCVCVCVCVNKKTFTNYHNYHIPIPCQGQLPDVPTGDITGDVPVDLPEVPTGQPTGLLAARHVALSAKRDLTQYSRNECQI